MRQFQTVDFEEALQENLALYTQENSSLNLFQTHREIMYARYALTQQANAYAKALEILFILLENSAQLAATNPKALTDVMVTINAIETKSSALISSVRSVTELLGRAVNIDVDKAALSSLVIRLPSLVKETIAKVSNNPQLADQIAGTLDARLNEIMIACRFNVSNLPQQEQQQIQGITFDQYAQLVDTVPTQPGAAQ